MREIEHRTEVYKKSKSFARLNRISLNGDTVKWVVRCVIERIIKSKDLQIHKRRVQTYKKRDENCNRNFVRITLILISARDLMFFCFLFSFIGIVLIIFHSNNEQTMEVNALSMCTIQKTINHLKDIKDVDSYVYNDTHLLNFNNKGLKVLYRDLFAPFVKDFDRVEFIYLMYNNLNTIENGSFDEFINVRNINFGVNLLTDIRGSYFHGVEKINFLNFRSNIINHIEPGAFDKLPMLEHIYLDDNCLTQVTQDLFVNTLGIRNVFLQQNMIEHVSNTFMRPTQKLYSLNLADNQLRDVSNLFRYDGLQSLIVSNNKLQSIKTNDISVQNQLMSLNMDNTGITDLFFISKFPKLKELYVANNQIRTFYVKNFQTNIELTYISMQGNPLMNINIINITDILPKLTVLDIAKVQFNNDCRKLLELNNYAKDKSVNLNINNMALNACI